VNESRDEFYMRLALAQAKLAAARGEVPTGCIIVHRSPGLSHENWRIVGKAHNQSELLKDPTAHAEILAITQAASALGDWRLENTVLYVTKEPCPMCGGAIVLARIPKVVFGVPDPQRGAASVFGLLNHPNLNHRCEVTGGILAEECRDLLQEFFRVRRDRNHSAGS